jgi:hypothetical protein
VGINTRRMSRNAAGLSGKNCSPCRHSTTSKDASGKGSAVTLPSFHSMEAQVAGELARDAEPTR